MLSNAPPADVLAVAPSATHPAPLSILMEMRPALDGFYGIPQETRLLFSALVSQPEFVLAGLLQMSKRGVAGGVYGDQALSDSERIHRFSRVVVSLKGRSAIDWRDGAVDEIASFLQTWRLRLGAWLGLKPIALGVFETRYFKDFVWQELFARTLPSQDRERVLQANYRVCKAPWRQMHRVGIERAQLTGRSQYPVVDTRGVDVLLVQTPYPGRVMPGTSLVVHYHDAIPVLMPHTISDRAFHQASHFQAMAANVRSGAHFVCVSEATRQDLLRLFPEVEPRAHVIHNMLPAHYYPAEPAPEKIPSIVRRYLHGQFEGKARGAVKGKTKLFQLARYFGNEDEKTHFYQQALSANTRYLLMVSTIEPRKNHARLLAAWEVIRSSIDPDLKLVLVGHIGWDYETALDSFKPWIEQGSLFLLHGLPADALRVLYRQATVTVCPSVGEGFDFSGVEAMRCGGIVAASEIPVHREVYGEAAEYFDPYDTASLVHSLSQIMYGEQAEAIQARLRDAGLEQSARYLPEKIIPQWLAFFKGLK
ncbi:MAG: glycosyltransferase family 4 protein [Halothiobacillaceae bacterium]|nr:glycosyltransferase family 4 protein [Halothiobacillaceae bacterium]